MIVSQWMETCRLAVELHHLQLLSLKGAHICRRRIVLFVIVLLSFGALAGQSVHELSPYEAESVAIAFDKLGLTPEPNPEGKVIESIEIVRLEIFEERDPIPAFIRRAGNSLHTTTREQFIRREVLLDPGEKYDQSLVDETERNLRRFASQFSIVLVVGARGSTNRTVRLVVITKDVWSLRLNTEVSGFGAQANTLMLQSAETNLSGMGRTVSGGVTMNPYTYRISGGFTEPRVHGSQVAFHGEGGLIWTCETREPEGGYVFVRYGKPLYTTRTRWARQVALYHRQAIRRLRTDASICSEPKQQFIGVVDPMDPTHVIDSIPSNISVETIRGQIGLTRSFGVTNKHNIGAGVEVARFIERTDDLSGYNPVAADLFKQQHLGQSDVRMGPYLQYHTYTTRFHRVLNVETLGFQEDFRLGHEVFLRVYPALRDLGSTRSLLGLFGSLAYTVRLGNGFARPWSALQIEVSERDQSDGEVTGGVRFVSPTVGIGRLIVDGRLRHRFMNYFNPVVQMTGAGRLRGYDFRGFTGVDFVTCNVELRTTGLELFNLLFGLAAFYDIGDAFNQRNEIRPKHGAGIGLRLVFPQGQREIIRLDFGLPLSSGPGIDMRRSPRIVFSFGQAFGVPRPTPSALIID